jgi:hypothetical protein
MSIMKAAISDEGKSETAEKTLRSGAGALDEAVHRKGNANCSSNQAGNAIKQAKALRGIPGQAVAL